MCVFGPEPNIIRCLMNNYKIKKAYKQALWIVFICFVLKFYVLVEKENHMKIKKFFQEMIILTKFMNKVKES